MNWRWVIRHVLWAAEKHTWLLKDYVPHCIRPHDSLCTFDPAGHCRSFFTSTVQKIYRHFTTIELQITSQVTRQAGRYQGRSFPEKEKQLVSHIERWAPSMYLPVKWLYFTVQPLHSVLVPWPVEKVGRYTSVSLPIIFFFKETRWTFMYKFVQD